MSEADVPETTNVEQADGRIDRRALLIGTAGGFAWSLAAPAARAQPAPTWPTRPVTMIIPFPAGGAMDVLGRAVAQDLGERLGQPVVV
ncbi:MAG: hypothetical protein IT537_11365, partial [Hyphomicrobiales bacterium]|nr:hypothetical protein [Hyphomicrobiales bacterium]